VTVVLDASVMIKWLLQDHELEEDTEKATQLVERVAKGDLTVLQPAHWLAEVGAVLARKSPTTACDDVTMLQALEFPVTSDPLVLRRAVQLAIDLDQHVFDTLYHAVALEMPETTLVTADQRYIRAARRKGQIMDLVDWK
jgi:predicted nucleic acid-binding protein